VQEKARANRGEVFTSVAHYVDEAALLRAYQGLRAGAAAGADGHNKASYGKGLKGRISALHERLETGSYRATPAKRVVLSKPDGGERTIHLQTVEDKLVQRAVAEVLNSIYEVDFAAFSYGFRPGKSAHQCLQALQTALQKGRVNWVLDLDLKACFDSIEHEALMAQVQQRVKDRSVLRLLRDALTVGYRDDNGRWQRQHRGTPQGAVISPLLANIVLNEAMDKTVHRWRQNHARGQVYIVRYADDVPRRCGRNWKPP
jgi:group II intron reverse transcriptase/maturase